ncbi:Serpin B6 [Anabarilius grahami]|uniref:Serpin B6 n=1 Tax=Anabarilius grahami TaxID=495550 RepID=A0A3N0Y9Y7_ANAGA|nr:Serpin B6 [Anabarilius grahami]
MSSALPTLNTTTEAVNKMEPDIEPVIWANSKFSIDMLKVFCKGNTANVLFSPLSISSALGLVLLGAKGETADQMYKDFLDNCEEWCFASMRNVDLKTNPDAAREKNQHLGGEEGRG